MNCWTILCNTVWGNPRKKQCQNVLWFTSLDISSKVNFITYLFYGVTLGWYYCGLFVIFLGSWSSSFVLFKKSEHDYPVSELVHLEATMDKVPCQLCSSWKQDFQWLSRTFIPLWIIFLNACCRWTWAWMTSSGRTSLRAAGEEERR